MIYYEYWLNRSDILVKANDAWFAFYSENVSGGSARKFIGHSFLDWIDGYEVQALFASLLIRARAGNVVADLPFRCDSPDTKRLLSMKLDLEDDNRVRFTTHLLESKSRPAIRWTTNQLVTMCGWCNRIAIGNEEEMSSWHQLDDAIKSMQLLEGEKAPNLTHGICPECKVSFLETVPSKHLRL